MNRTGPTTRPSTTRLAVIAAALMLIAAVTGTSASGAPKSRARATKPTAARLATSTSAAQATTITTAVRASTTTRATVSTPQTAASTTVVTTAPIPLKGSITLFAASSLTASFSDIVDAFKAANPAVEVVTSFAGSSTLAGQIQSGAPVDVFASADEPTMQRLAVAGLVSGPAPIFTRNRLMIVVPKGNPLRVTGLSDLARPEVFVALAAPEVPAGRYARDILTRAGVVVKPKTLEPNVKSIIALAALREIDAGIVYVTDVAVEDYRVDGVTIPEAQNEIASYPIATLTAAKNRPTAEAFVQFVQSPSAQAILRKYGFLAPK